jgi:hypothetical protein
MITEIKLGAIAILILGLVLFFWFPEHREFGQNESRGGPIWNEVGQEAGYATSGSAVSYRGGVLEGADPATLVVLDAYYAKDANHVYFNSSPLVQSSVPSVLQGADPSTFTLCKGVVDRDDCAQDISHVYVDGALLPQADPRTFMMLNDSYGKDAAHAYFAPLGTSGGYAIGNADAPTFVALDAAYAKDIRNVYYKGKQVAGADAASFTVVAGEPYDASDSYAHYLNGQTLR